MMHPMKVNTRRIAPLVVERQSVAVDAIAGATYSGKVILKAGQIALESGIR